MKKLNLLIFLILFPLVCYSAAIRTDAGSIMGKKVTAPAAGNNAQALTYDHGTSMFVYQAITAGEPADATIIKEAELSSSTSSTSVTTAANSVAVKTTYDLAAGKQSPATTLVGYGITDAATATQGGKADTAVQPGDTAAWDKDASNDLVLGTTSTTAHQGDLGTTAYNHSQAVHAPSGAEVNVNADWGAASGDAFILNKPTLGTAADNAEGDFATAAQGSIANSALQPLMSLTATAANSFVAGNVGFVAAAGTVTLADASAEATAKNLLVIATATIAGGASGSFMLTGPLTLTAHGYTIGLPLFLSETAGGLTTTAPATTGAIVRVVGYAYTANAIYIVPAPTFVEVP